MAWPAWACLALLVCASGCGARTIKGDRTRVISLENRSTGTAELRLERPAEAHEVEGYALSQSVVQDSVLEVAISVSVPGTSVTWKAFRIGMYGGAFVRLVGEGDVPATSQPPCPMDDDGLVACHWHPTARIPVDGTYPPGVYVLQLIREDGYGSYVPFVVRSRQIRPDVVALLPTTTWAAYNEWGGASLYQALAGKTRSGHADRVSFDRPYARGHGAATLLEVERWAITWLESQELEVSYVSIEDVDRDPALLEQGNAVVIIGHDEYWTPTLRRTLDAAVEGDLSLLVLGANVGYWQARLEAADDGRDRRTVVCFKEDAAAFDPVGRNSPELTVQFRQAPVRRPERWLFGEQYEDRWGFLDMPLAVGSVADWAFRGTGFEPGDTVPRGTGYEIDTVGKQLPLDLTVLTDSPFLSVMHASGRAQMSVRRVPGGWVFAAGSADFARLLADPQVADRRIRRLLTNVLDAAIERSVRPPEPPLPDAAEAASTPLWAPARDVATWAGRPGERGNRLGSRLRARFEAPLSLAAGPDGTLWVGDVGNHHVLRIGPDGMVTAPRELSGIRLPQALTVARDGTLYALDGATGTVWRRRPGGSVDAVAGAPLGRGLAVSPDGRTLYVASTWEGAVLAVDLAASGHPVRRLIEQLDHPTGLAVGPDGALHVQEAGARILRWVDGSLDVVAGSGHLGFRDGPASEARFIAQDGLAVLPDRSLVVSDPGNYRLRRIANGVVTTLAGTGRMGNRDGPGDRAELVMPTGLAVAPGGGLWVAETGNGAIRLVIP